MAVLGTKSESIFLERIFSNSTTWTPSFSCRAYVTVIGPGGSAAHARGTTDHQSYAASGGGGGGCAKSLLVLSSSVTYTVTIGAGGDGATNAGDGSDGSANSVFSGSDITTMTANLGSGGNQYVDSDNIAMAGGAGGAATGGSIWNVTGGAGGSATMAGWDNRDAEGTFYVVGGGGAAGVLGEAFRGGNALINLSNGFDCAAYAGGAGVGGRGGDATITGGEKSSASGQGGSGDRAGADASTGTAADHPGPWQTIESGDLIVDSTNYQSLTRLPLTAGPFKHNSAESRYHTMKINQGLPASIFHGLTGQAGSRVQNNNQVFSGPGAGGGGYWPVSDQFITYTVPGLFGGGGTSGPSYYGAGGATATGYGAAGSYGAGGGAVSQYASSSNTSYSGAGGSGLVVVTILEAL